MHIGGERTLIIPSENLGYGAGGAGGVPSRRAPH
jgi:FKBP-type peptidyl-prolyl cis-trans isomerase